MSANPLAYKVKTTAPQRYCVRPNNGVLPPGETIEVQVLLNIVKDAPPNLETRDKFQIQSIVLSGPLGNATDIGEVWSKATPEQITKQKLKSRFTATTKPAIPPPTIPSETTTTAPNTGIPETSPQTITTTITTTTTTAPPHDETPPLPSVTPLNSSQNSLNASQSQLNNSSSLLKSSLSTPNTSQIFSSQGNPSPPQTINQSSLDRKDSFRESSDQHQFFTPTITALASKDTKPNIPHTNLDKSLEVSKFEQPIEPKHEPPKPTGDYVMDSVANHTQLRKALEQVATLKSERENVNKDNQKLHEQVKSLTDLLLRAKEESQQTGLRQRTTTSHTPGGPTSTHPSLATAASQQSVVQIQTQVLLFIVFFFSIIGFLLGRFTR